jgi:Tol biopolymer transport system component
LYRRLLTIASATVRIGRVENRFGRLMPALVVVVAAGAAIAWSMRRSGSEADPARLAWVATARQFGPVSYRDPAGAISPDGKWIAYSEGRFLRVRSVGGGPALDLAPGDAQIRNLSWNRDGRTILADGFGTQSGWGMYDIAARTAVARPELQVRGAVWSPDGKKIAGIANGRVRIFTAEGDVELKEPSSGVTTVAWTPGGDVACIATEDGRSRVRIPCDGRSLRLDPDLDAYGPMAFSPDGRTMYVALANRAGTLDLWTAGVDGGRARRLTSFSRDTYAPTVAADGAMVFKVQSYRTVVSVVPASGGAAAPVATFQSETPSWDPAGRSIGVTYGTWRRVVDDSHYPDIAQDAGILPADPAHPAAAPSKIVHASASEDQSLCWSPNGRWLAFHSHEEGADDIFLRSAGDDATARRISFLGRGAETGWPRWSPDGRWILFSGASRSTHRTVIYAVGADQESGGVTSTAREIAVHGIDADVTHAEWLPDSAHFVAVGKEGPGRHIIITTSRDGMDTRVIRRFASEHDMPGIGVSPDGREVAFIAPAADGYFQVFRIPLAGGEPVQVTTDPSNKTQPAWSPDGRTIAMTVWNYDAQFWMIR